MPGPVVFLHGAGQDAGAARWLDVPGMAALTLPGHGIRRRQRSGMRLGDIADEIAGWATEPLHVVGTSVGGMVALHLALDYPQLVRSLVLATTLPNCPSDEFVEARAQRTESLGSEGMVQETMDRWFTAETLSKTPRPAPVAYAEAQLARTATGAAADIWRAMLGYDVRDRLGSISVPTTCIGASADISTPSSNVAEMADLIPGAEFVEVEAAHAAHLEVPQEFSEVVRNHLGVREIA
jgi:3-oxoadipate enol-lactonase